MTDDKERVDWSALMDAHGIEPDADTASPAVEPARREEQPADEPAGRRAAARSRLVHVVVAVTALFSIAASAAVLVAILRGGDGDRGGAGAAADPPMVPVGPRPAAFEQTTDGVTVVPPAAAQASPAAAESPSPAAKSPPSAAEKPPSGAENPPRPAAEEPPSGAENPPRPAAESPPPAAKKPPSAAKKPPATAEAPPPAAETPPSAAAEPEPSDASLPDEPDNAGVASAMAALQKDIAACAAPAKVSGAVGIKMRIEPDGSVAWASAKVQNSPFQACLDRLFKKARMPRSAKGATVRQTVTLP